MSVLFMVSKAWALNIAGKLMYGSNGSKQSMCHQCMSMAVYTQIHSNGWYVTHNLLPVSVLRNH
jgi:hypothetical protein